MKLLSLLLTLVANYNFIFKYLIYDLVMIANNFVKLQNLKGIIYDTYKHNTSSFR